MHLFAKITPAKTRSAVSSLRSLRLPLAALSLLAAFGQPLTPAQAAEPRVALTANSAPSSALRTAHLLGRLESSATLRVGLTLPLRNQSQLSELIRRQYTPGDPLFHQFLTPPEFTERFGPSVSDYAAVTAYALAQGLTVTSTSPGRTLLNVMGPSARIESAFGVQMSRYRLPEGRLVYANSTAPRLPASIAARVAGIAGLNNIAQMRPHLSRMKSGALGGYSQSSLRSNAPVPVTGTGTGIGSGPLGGLTPNDIKYAYNLNTITTLYGSSTTAPTASLTGAGQNIGLFELDGYLPADITAYVTAFGLPTVTSGTAAPVTTILLDGFDGTPLVSTDQGGQTEVTLDIDMILALAPAATGVYVYEAVDAGAPLSIFTRMVTDLNPNGSKKPLLSVISCSWGISESLEDPAILSGENTLFQQMATQGQSLYVASGDQGAYDLYTATPPSGQTAPAVDNPASQPYATGVGGTTLSYVKPSTNVTTGAVTPGAYVGETVWSVGSISNPGGSGGGVSSIWPKPSYQVGVGSSSLRREVPDVSLNADPNTGYTIFIGSTATVAGTAEVIGGTSAAAPLWAAYTALINEQRAANGLTSIGFINPLLYPIATGSSYLTDFHDITTGSNLFYQAGTGYDDATGLGSFNGAPLLAALTINANQGTGTATLTGIVTDSSGIVVAGAVVTATNPATSAVVATATTDTTGTYTLTVPSGFALVITVTTSGVTAPKTESLTGQILNIPALTASTSTTLPITLVASHVYAAGLQMISAPYSYAGLGDFAVVFGLTEAAANVSPRLAQYAPSLNTYLFYPAAPADTLRLGQGYWVRFPSTLPNTAYLHITGTAAPTTQAFSIPLAQGWNQIGDPFLLAAPLSTISVVTTGGSSALLPAAGGFINTVLYGFNTTSGAYAALNAASDSLNPYAGYWIYAFQPCTLSVPFPGPPISPLGGPLN